MKSEIRSFSSLFDVPMNSCTKIVCCSIVLLVLAILLDKFEVGVKSDFLADPHIISLKKNSRLELNMSLFRAVYVTTPNLEVAKKIAQYANFRTFF